MVFTFAAFQALWNGRQFAHITLTEIEAYARIYSIHDVERFATLIMFCDRTVHNVAEKIADEKDRIEKHTRQGSG